MHDFVIFAKNDSAQRNRGASTKDCYYIVQLLLFIKNAQDTERTLVPYLRNDIFAGEVFKFFKNEN